MGKMGKSVRNQIGIMQKKKKRQQQSPIIWVEYFFGYNMYYHNKKRINKMALVRLRWASIQYTRVFDGLRCEHAVTNVSCGFWFPSDKHKHLLLPLLK